MSSPRIHVASRPAERLGLALGLAVTVCALGCSSAPHAAQTGAAKGSYAFWPQFPDEPRVQFLKSFSSSDDVAPVKSGILESLVFGKEGVKAAAINKPYGAAMHDGKIYVCDMRAKALVVLDLKKKQTRLVGVSGLNQLEHPVAVAVADDGMIYVADNGRGAVFVYDLSERYSRVFGFEKFRPVALAVHGDRLYAADLNAQVVQVFDRRDGKRLDSVGAVGDGDGQFRVPLGISTDKQGNLYVVDMMRCRVQKFGPEGNFLSGTGSMGDFAGAFIRPKHIAVDNDGIVYVVDAAFQNVQMFDDQNRLLMHFGAAGNFPGSMNLPAGICVSEEGLEYFKEDIHPGFDAKRLIVVTNQFGDQKVGVYALGTVKKGYTAADLAAAAASIPAGVGVNEESLKMMSPAGQPMGEPPPEEAKADEKPQPKKPD